jgi:hypothetical protein
LSTRKRLIPSGKEKFSYSNYALNLPKPLLKEKIRQPCEYVGVEMSQGKDIHVSHLSLPHVSGAATMAEVGSKECTHRIDFADASLENDQTLIARLIGWIFSKRV